jgi:hypothetical protein
MLFDSMTLLDNNKNLCEFYSILLPFAWNQYIYIFSSQLALNSGWTFKLADDILIGQITEDNTGTVYNVYR